jgi:hypothetical protein
MGPCMTSTGQAFRSMPEITNEGLAVEIAKCNSEIGLIRMRLDALDLNDSLPVWKDFVRRLPEVIKVLDRVEMDIARDQRKQMAYEYLGEVFAFARPTKKWWGAVAGGFFWSVGVLVLALLEGWIKAPGFRP